MSNFKFNFSEKTIADNRVGMKPILRRNWYAVGNDGKKSYIVNISDANRAEANYEATRWAKKEGLTLEVVRAK